MNRFGDYLKSKRREKNISIRDLSKQLDVSVSYISELETGKKLPPNSKEEKYVDLLDRISKSLSLTDSEYSELRNLADVDLEASGYVSNDMADYFNNVPLASIALRKAKECNLNENDWNKIIKNMNNK